MNKVNVQHAINIMQRVKIRGSHALDMGQWQRQKEGWIKSTEVELSNCGMAACLGGWIAVSHEFIAAGGEAHHFQGCPVLDGDVGSNAIARWLGIDLGEGELLCHVKRGESLYQGDSVSPDDVIKILQRLLKTGSVWGQSK